MRFGAYKKLLFDLDNTLVNSSEIVLWSMRLWCKEHQVNLERALKFGEGRRTEDTIKIVAPHLDAVKEAKKIEDLEEHLVENTKPIFGAQEFTRAISRTDWAVVTSSSFRLVGPKLNAAKIVIPDVIVSADCVKNGKPAPDPYEKAMEMLSVIPDECLVFEDADSGVESAIAAGCRVVVIGNSVSVSHSNIVGNVPDFSHLTVTTNGSLMVGIKNPSGSD